MANQVKADYDAIKDASQKFFAESDRIYKTLNSLKDQANGLQGKWVGQGANQFQQEMQSSIEPAFKRLYLAMNEAGNKCIDISNIFQKAEQEAKVIVTIKIS
jgi:WXG100 family type VII secretion target